MLTYEEFRQAVKKHYLVMMKEYELQESELEKLLVANEDIIRDRYAYGKKKLEANEISNEQFKLGVASGCASCLHLMY